MKGAITIRDYRTEIPGALDGNTWQFPPVITMSSKGQEIKWQLNVRVIDQFGNFVDISDDWFDSTPMPEGLRGWIKVDTGMKGNINKSAPTIISCGLNEGKINATNVWTQALRDALGMYNKKTRKSSNYAPIGDVKMYPPMLANNYEPASTKLPDRVYVQRKYNGIRAIATLRPDGTVFIYSRGLKELPGLSYIRDELQHILAPGVYIDGELYTHEVSLQKLSGDIRRGVSDSKHGYVIYDCFKPDEPELKFSERQDILADMIIGDFEHIKLAETLFVGRAEIDEYFKRWTEQKFEGLMVRTDSEYIFGYNGHRSNGLLKLKEKFDDELEIVGYDVAKKGKASGALMIICRAKCGQDFPVTPAMELPVRIELAKKMPMIEANGRTYFENHWAGKRIIVEYDELSNSGLPQRARTEMIIRTWD